MGIKVFDPRNLSMASILDEKLKNYYVDESTGNYIIESILEYLLRVTFEHRFPETEVIILLPKVDTSPSFSYSTTEDFDAGLNDFDGRQYAFIGGLADENFIEIPGTASKTAIPFTNIDNPDIPDYSIYAAKYGQYPKMPQVDLYFINENGNPAKHTAQPEFILDDDNLIVSINFGTFSDPLSGFILLQ
ncbi:MAG TPA: hypothetical protein VIK55_06715 [Paludibacter sp.]